VCFWHLLPWAEDPSRRSRRGRGWRRGCTEMPVLRLDGHDAAVPQVRANSATYSTVPDSPTLLPRMLPALHLLHPSGQQRAGLPDRAQARRFIGTWQNAHLIAECQTTGRWPRGRRPVLFPLPCAGGSFRPLRCTFGPMATFDLKLPFELSGDQPSAIEELAAGFQSGERYQTLHGGTGSGKTVTMANVIQRLGRPTLVMSHNKTLAAQLYGELKQFFPHNA